MSVPGSADGGPRVLDLSNGEPPVPRRVRVPPWPAVIVHHRWGEDDLHPGDDPHVYRPDEPADLRCPGCRADAGVLVGEDIGLILLVVMHQRGCGLADRVTPRDQS